jgi:hypothetical protein
LTGPPHFYINTVFIFRIFPMKIKKTHFGGWIGNLV